MKRKNKIVFIIAVTLIMVFLCSVPAFAISESEVQAAVDEQGKMLSREIYSSGSCVRLPF